MEMRRRRKRRRLRRREEASGSTSLSSQTKLCIIQPQNRDNSLFRKENNMFTRLHSTEISVRGRPHTVKDLDKFSAICKLHTVNYTL